MIKGCDSGAPVSNYAPRLAAMGIRAVGRYYVKTNSPKDWRFFSEAERDIICRNRMRVISIWQHKGKRAEYTYKNGKTHAIAAIANAVRLQQPPWTKIYAAVDYDAPDSDIRNGILPYMSEFKEELTRVGYHLGVYGSGAVILATKFHAISAAEFLAGATGWRGYKEAKGEAEIIQYPETKPFKPDQFGIDPLDITDLDRAGTWTV